MYFTVDKLITFPQKSIAQGWMDGRKVGCVQQESSFWTRELYEAVGGLDSKYKLAGDYTLWIEFAKKEKLWSLNTVLAGFRVHSGQKSENKNAYFGEMPELSLLEKVANKFHYYTILNRIRKNKNNIMDVKGIISER